MLCIECNIVAFPLFQTVHYESHNLIEQSATKQPGAPSWARLTLLLPISAPKPSSEGPWPDGFIHNETGHGLTTSQMMWNYFLPTFLAWWSGSCGWLCPWPGCAVVKYCQLWCCCGVVVLGQFWVLSLVTVSRPCPCHPRPASSRYSRINRYNSKHHQKYFFFSLYLLTHTK